MGHGPLDLYDLLGPNHFKSGSLKISLRRYAAVKVRFSALFFDRKRPPPEAARGLTRRFGVSETSADPNSGSGGGCDPAGCGAEPHEENFGQNTPSNVCPSLDLPDRGMIVGFFLSRSSDLRVLYTMTSTPL